MLREMTIRKMRPLSDLIPVKTWCRICGLPVMLEVLPYYDEAVRHFHALDDTPMVHKNGHSESGGWGVHWRLDEVLQLLFNTEKEEEFFPLYPGWVTEYGEPLAEDEEVQIIGDGTIEGVRQEHMDVELLMLSKQINEAPRSREELMRLGEEVWDTDEVRENFEILGFKKPFALAINVVTGDKGSLLFQDNPRYYFGWSVSRII